MRFQLPSAVLNTSNCRKKQHTSFHHFSTVPSFTCCVMQYGCDAMPILKIKDQDGYALHCVNGHRGPDDASTMVALDGRLSLPRVRNTAQGPIQEHHGILVSLYFCEVCYYCEFYLARS